MKLIDSGLMFRKTAKPLWTDWEKPGLDRFADTQTNRHPEWPGRAGQAELT